MESDVSAELLKAIVPGVMEAMPFLIVYDDTPDIVLPLMPGPSFSVQAIGSGAGEGLGLGLGLGVGIGAGAGDGASSLSPPPPQATSAHSAAKVARLFLVCICFPHDVSDLPIKPLPTLESIPCSERILPLIAASLTLLNLMSTY